MYHEAPEKKAYWRVKSYFKEMQKVFLFFCFLKTETEGFKIDTMGTYHGMTLKSVTVSSYVMRPVCF